MSRGDLTDTEWRILNPLLPDRGVTPSLAAQGGQRLPPYLTTANDIEQAGQAAVEGRQCAFQRPTADAA